MLEIRPLFGPICLYCTWKMLEQMFPVHSTCHICVISSCRYGESNPTYRLHTTSGQEYVLRKQPPGQLLAGAHRVDREYRIISALSKVHFPVPKPLLFCSNTSVIGTEFYIMECVEVICNNPQDQVIIPVLLQVHISFLIV